MPLQAMYGLRFCVIPLSIIVAGVQPWLEQAQRQLSYNFEESNSSKSDWQLSSSLSKIPKSHA